MAYKLFLDDIRDVNMVYKKLTNNDFVVVRNFHDFKKVIIENGLPELISFDNDLGLDENDLIAEDGYAAAKWLVYESELDLINLKFNVHSANPVAAQQIQSLLDNYIKHLKRENNN
ncbi:cyclic-phosphate processing receiver domain-containing protein [Pseudomonas shirazensis]